MKITFLIGHLIYERHNLIYEMLQDFSKYFQVNVITGYPSRGLSSTDIERYRNNPN